MTVAIGAVGVFVGLAVGLAIGYCDGISIGREKGRRETASNAHNYWKKFYEAEMMRRFDDYADRCKKAINEIPFGTHNL